MHSPLLGRGPAECICNLQLQPSHSDPTSLGQGDCRVHLQSGIAAKPPIRMQRTVLQLQPRSCNCSRDPAIAAEILQLQPRGARLQFQIANALCRLSAQGEGGGPNGSAAITDCKCTLQALRPRGGLEPHINTQMFSNEAKDC